jgi:uncharacterized OB-fold protein
MVHIITIDKARTYPPRVTAFTRVFWDALREGQLRTTSCNDCGKFSFPPKPFCPHCWCKQVSWRDLSGRGRLYAATVIHAAPTAFKDEAPYRVGIVDLEEGMRLATRVIGEGDIRLDAAVEIVVLNYHDGPLFAARL